MKKRIFAILCIVITLSLFAFPIFAAVNHDDMKKEKVYSVNGSVTGGVTSHFVDTVTLNEGLYIIDCMLHFLEDFFFDGGIYFKEAQDDRTILFYEPVFELDRFCNKTYYFYITVPITITFHCEPGSYVDYFIDIWSTKTYSEIRYEGYGYGYDDGYYDGWEDAGSDYDDGYSEGYDVGYGVGWGDGSSDGYDSGYDTGENNGYSSGYTNGKNDGLTDGYNNGYSVGKTEGYAEGRQIAQDAAYAQGKQDGFNEAIEDSEEIKTAIGGIFSGIFDGCVNSFNELTEGVTLMGITLKQILLTIVSIGLIGICIWLFALKK